MSKIVINNDGEGNNLNEPDVNFKTAEEIANEEATETARLEAVENETVTDKPNDDSATTVSIDNVDYILNEDGNAVNEDGSIFKSKEELEALNGDEDEDTLVEINGEQFKLNDKGDAVDDSGEVAYSKEDIDEMSEGETPAFDIGEISKDTALEIYTDSGEVVEYENTTEGLKQYNQDVYSKGGNDALHNLYESFPEVESLVKHIQLGGDMNSFNARVDYGKVKLNKENEAQLKDIIYKAQTARGNRTDAIDKYYNALIAGDTDNDNVFEEAALELKFLQDKDKDFNDEQERLLLEQQANERRDSDLYWGVNVEDGNLKDLGNDDSVFGIIKSGKIKLQDKTFTIPKQIRVIENNKPVMYNSNDFFKYLYEPITTVIDGKRVTTTRDNIKLQIEQQNRTISNQVYDAYRRFVNYDDSQFIAEQIQNDKVKTIKKLTTKRSYKSTGSKKKATSGRVVIK